MVVAFKTSSLNFVKSLLSEKLQVHGWFYLGAMEHMVPTEPGSQAPHVLHDSSCEWTYYETQ